MKIITAAIIKGGGGKTTTVAALAQAAAAAGKTVLTIDLDPQGNLSSIIGADTTGPDVYAVIVNGLPIAEAIQTTAQGIDIIPSSPDLATIQTRPGSARRLQKALEPIRGLYDYVFIDTPPQIGELTYNALMASTGLIIPMETDTNNLQGLYQIADIAQQIQTNNPALSILGAIVTRYDGRPSLNRYLLQSIKDKAEESGIPFLKAIRAGIAIRESQAMQQSLFDYAPRSKPAEDYKSLYAMLEGGNHG